MRALVTGAAGYLGRAVVRSLSGSGYTVRGLVRSPDQLDSVARSGGEPVVGDVTVPATLDPAVASCDLVVHLALSRSPDLAAQRAVRVTGATNLARAAARAKVPRLLVGSGYWVYPDTAGMLTEESPVSPLGLSQVNFDAEGAAVAASDGTDLDVVIVRPGMVYGDGSWFRQMVDEVSQGTHEFIGSGANRMSPIHLDDAAAAFRLIGERSPPGAKFIVVDDQPVPIREFVAFVEEQLGRGSSHSISVEQATREWGRELAVLNAANRAASNARLRAIGFAPRYPTFRDGVPAVLRGMGAVEGQGARGPQSPERPR